MKQHLYWVVNCFIRLKFYVKKSFDEHYSALGISQFIFVTSGVYITAELDKNQ